MKSQSQTQRQIVDLERAAWMARLAFGGYQAQVPASVQPRRNSASFVVMP